VAHAGVRFSSTVAVAVAAVAAVAVAAVVVAAAAVAVATIAVAVTAVLRPLGGGAGGGTCALDLALNSIRKSAQTIYFSIAL